MKTVSMNYGCLRASSIGLAIFSCWGFAFAADLNRSPECLKEQLALDAYQSKVATEGVPLGKEIIPATLIGDPLYNNGQWSKYQAEYIVRERPTPFASVRRYEMTFHYMYNHVTGVTSQWKLKSTRDQGCVGTIVLANMDDIEMQEYWARYSYNGQAGFDEVWSAQTGRVVSGPLVNVGSGGCVEVNSILPGGIRAGDVLVGTELQLCEPRNMEASKGIVTYSKTESVAGFRIETSSGASLLCSESAPIPTKDGLVTAPNLLGKQVPIRRDVAAGSDIAWERVTVVVAIGMIDVQHITVGDRCFWAGEHAGVYMLHHNLKMSIDSVETSLTGWWY